MVEFDEIKKLLNKEVLFIWGSKERRGKITILDEDSKCFHYEYSDPNQSAGMGGVACSVNVIKIEGNNVIFN